MNITSNNNDVKWKVGDVIRTPDDTLFLICGNLNTQRFSLCNLCSGAGVGSYETIEELCEDLISSEDVKCECRCMIGGM